MALIAAKHHMGKLLELDAGEEHWADARQICQDHLGYGWETDLFEPHQEQAA